MADTDSTHQALVRLLGPRMTEALLAETLPSFLIAADGRSVLYTDKAASKQLGLIKTDLDHPLRLAEGAPGSARLAAIGDNPSISGPRLERLRFFSGMRGIALTALCRRVVLLSGEAAVLCSVIPPTHAPSADTPLVTQDNLQAMIAAAKTPIAETNHPSSPQLVETSLPQDQKTTVSSVVVTPEQAQPLAARMPASGRFVFALDSAGNLTRISQHFQTAVGADNAPAVGENFAEFVASFDLEVAEKLNAGVASGETWEGINLNWPLDDGRSVAPVELSALPILDSLSKIAGYSGFGRLRLQARFEAPTTMAPLAAQDTETTLVSHDLFSPHVSASDPNTSDVSSINSESVQNAQPAEEKHLEIREMASHPQAELLPTGNKTSSHSKIVSIKTGQATTEFPGFQRHGLSSTERNAFREIAKALGAKMEGQDEDPESTGATPTYVQGDSQPPASPAARSDQDNSFAGQPSVIGNETDLLDRLPIGLLILAGDQPLFVNRTLLDLTGYPDQTNFAARDGARAIFRKSNRPNAEADGINTMVLSTVDGEMVPVDSLLQRVVWQGQNATLISFRRAVELEQGKALRSVALDLNRARKEGDELRSILNTATDGVITVDDAGVILSMNGSAEALFGVHANEAVGEPLISLMHRDSHAEALDYLDGLKRNGVRSVLNDGRDVFGREKKGGRIPLFMTLGRISEEDPPRYCAVLRDLTAWKRAEADLTEARRAAEAASAKKSDFLAKISHEIRTPMNAIIGFSEVMQEERLGPLGNPKYREYLGDIQTSGRHVVSLVNDLLDLAKIEAGRMELDFAATDLNAVVTSAVSIIQPQANASRILIRSQLAPSLPPVVADERSIRQILLNMLSNATRFTESGGQVIVATALLDSGEAVIRIRDTGIGMTTGEIEQAMEPFRQVGTRRSSGGTGLGLPLTKALVEANRAAFAIRSTPGEGTLIEVIFPATRVLAE